ncbi:MAG: co-chaperone GroES family protein [Bacteroidetes bacterium]|nr:co-chaperone GroES family protein [Bacteroidota bacterium]
MEFKIKKKILLVGDRILISPEKEMDKTRHGLYLPPSVKEKEKVQGGYVVKIGPGYPIVNPNFVEQESWSTEHKEPIKYIPLQAEEGDYVLFLRDTAIEIEFEEQNYLIIQQSSILMLIRHESIPDFTTSKK